MKVYISYSYNRYNDLQQVRELLSRSAGVEIVQIHDFSVREPITSQLVSQIKGADAVIADITDDNANVYYEIGLAHAFNKPVILISQANNFNRLPPTSDIFYRYTSSPDGIRNLSFRLEQLLTSQKELDKLRPLSRRKQSVNFESAPTGNRVKEIIQYSGSSKYYAFEKWVYELLIEIPGFEVQLNHQRAGKEYDFIIWNTNQIEELEGLGNPVPVEVKASEKLGSKSIYELIGKADAQGFKSFILITLTNLSQGNLALIKDLKERLGIVILAIGKDDLMHVNSSGDMLRLLITSFRRFFIY